MNYLRYSIAVALAGGLFAPLGLAQDSGSLLEEITVTAQRREESLQEVPLAVTAFNDEQLERLQITEALDLTKLVPNLIGHNNTGLGSANVYSLRGLNNTESIATFDPPVGSYVNDIYVSRQNGNNFAFFDVDRVEVLRGPQGTLFGRNTTGGAVRVILKRPSEERGGFVEAGFGEFDRLSLRATVDVPISDNFLTKFSAYYVEDDGFVDNLTTGEDDVNQEENKGIRGAFTWMPNETVTWDLSLDYIEADHANLLNFDDNGNRITNTGLVQNGAPLAGIVTGNKQNFGLGNVTESLLLSSNLVFDTRVGELEFVTGILNLDQEFNLDFFDGPFPTGIFTITNEGEHDQFTQEIKLTGNIGDNLDFVTGFFYIDEDNTTDFADIFTLNFGTPEAPIPFPLVLADRVLDNTTEAYAFYAQGDYSFNEAWTLTFGARWTHEDKDIGYTPNSAGGFGTADIQALNIATEQTKAIWTPRLALEYRPSDSLMFFGSITDGFKSGGWNARGTSADTIQPFGAEEVTSIELGMRADFLDNRLRVNLTAFQADVDDFQVPSAFNTPGGQIIFITRNFAGLDNKGLEAEIIAAPTENLTLFANIGLQDAEYVDLDPTIVAQRQVCQAQLAAGEAPTSCGTGIVTRLGGIAEPTRTPDYTAAIGGNYLFNLGSGYTLIPSVTVRLQDDFVVGTNRGPEDRSKGETFVRAGITLENPDDTWSLTLECQNCTDKEQVVSALAGFEYIDDPRTWNLRFRYRY